ncbi:unnamed protein product [Prunus armeniaca]
MGWVWVLGARARDGFRLGLEVDLECGMGGSGWDLGLMGLMRLMETLLDQQTIHNGYRSQDKHKISRTPHTDKISKQQMVIATCSMCDTSGKTQNHIQIQRQNMYQFKLKAKSNIQHTK